ncbi:ankyrin repeat domain-containing protein 2A-like [Zingiber officinale]|uniref:STI1 domain-containing protein n=1 Tax=Zingiber officinale TaxID=94328 RepID=A0A8J5KHZ1_ZINOF|nr:ankyrin repeat domain-containing protein 2A-like [Zingiber officinale]KAG6480492.1 hypothetical protein ZIOFF_063992 [Zingiber officinale]
MAEQISKNPVVCEMIVDMAEQIAEDPVYSQMVEQHQKSVPSTGQDIIPPLDPQQLISTVQQLRENPKLMKMSQHLRNAIMQDPVLSSMIGSKEQIEEQIARIKKNRALKGVLEEK